MTTKFPEYSLCPKCQKFQDKTYRKFCGDCGTALINKCPECSSPFYEKSDFCAQCGHKTVTQKA
jgi:hypothetical protein